MVIKQIGSATGNVVESTGKGFSEATKGIPWWGKAAIIAGGVGVAGYLVYYTINRISGPPGGSCTTPGSPCYSALAPYQQAFQICANEYAQNLQQYLKEDNANNTGFTQAQLDNLNQLTSCMNQNASQIAKTAKKYEPESAIDIIATYVGYAAITAVGIYFGSKAGVSIFNSLKNNKPISGSDCANAMKQVGVRYNYENGNISPDEASGLENQFPDITDADIQGNDVFMESLADDEVVTADEAATLSAEDAAAMDADTEDTIDELLSFGE